MRAHSCRLALLVGLAACTVQLELPEGAEIECRSDADCPEGLVCKTAIGLCYEPGGSDEVPGIVAGTLVIDPPQATVNREVTVSFEVTEELTSAPELVLSAAVSTPLTFESASGRTYVYSYRPKLADTAGTWPLYVTLFDQQGNLVEDLPLGTLTLDFTLPQILALDSGKRLYRGGEHLTVFFRLDEPADPEVLPSVRLADGTPLAAETPPAADMFQFGYDVPANAPFGPLALTIAAQDVAGNPVEQVWSAISLDTVRPVATQRTVARAYVAEGTIAGASFAASEPLVGTTVMLVPQTGGTSLPMTLDSDAGLRYSFSRAILSSDADGTYDVVVTAGVDEAGNALEGLPITLGVSTLDKVEPQFDVPPTTDKAPPHYRAGESVTLTFTVSKALASLPTVLIDADLPLAAPCTLVSATSYSCTTAALTGSETPEGTLTARLEVEDLAGHVVSSTATVVLDFTPPAVVGLSPVRLVPSDTNLRAALGLGLTGAGQGTTVVVSFAVDELLGQDPVVRTLPAGGTLFDGLTLSQSAGSGTTSLVYEVVVPAFASEGLHAVRAWLTDVAGNAAEEVPLGAELLVDSSTPNAPSTSCADAITYERRPWVAGSTAGAHRILGRGAATSGCGGGAVDAEALVVAYGSTAAGAPRLGYAIADADGAFDLALDGLDRTRVYVQAVDGAGNAGGRFLVRDVLWVATLANKTRGSVLENPHSLSERRWFLDDLSTTGEAELEGAALAAADGSAVTSTGGGSWRRFAPTFAPTARSRALAAYDSHRGRVVLFGARTQQAGALETLEWNGHEWVRPLLFDPEGDGEPSASEWAAMAYDPGRRVIVLASFADTWEYDGYSWKRVFQNVNGYPHERDGAALGYDRASSTVLMFGGKHSGSCFTDYYNYDALACGGTWDWNGQSWTLRQPATSPEPRWGHAMAYDETSGRVVLYGGCFPGALASCDISKPSYTDVWEWYDGNWHRVTPTGADKPGALYAPTLTYHAGLGRVVLYGGCPAASANTTNDRCTSSPSSTLWAWDSASASFSIITPTDEERDGNPVPVFAHAAAYDASRGTLLVSGGDACYQSPFTCSVNETRAETWSLRDRRDAAFTLVSRSWQRLGVTSLSAPSARKGMTLAYDSDRGRIVMFGGQLTSSATTNDTWEWTGTQWQQMIAAGGSSPAVKRFHAMAYDDGDDVTRLVGGDYEGFSVYAWNGSVWASTTFLDPEGDGNPMPAGQSFPNATLVYDRDLGTTLLYGGYGTTPSSATWRWVGGAGSGSWERLATTAPAGTELNPVMGFEASTSTVLLLGQRALYAFTGAGWASLGAWSAGAGPNVPLNHFLTPQGPMIHELGRDKMQLFFDRNVVSTAPAIPLWEWNGSGWTAQAPADPEGDGNPTPRVDYGLAADHGRGLALLYGGVSGTGIGGGTPRDDTWLWDGGAAARPGQVARIGFHAARVLQSDNASLERVSARWRAGATGHLGTVPTSGVELLAWELDRFVQVATIANDPTSPGDLSFTTSDAAQLSRLFQGSGQTLVLAARPLGRNGTGTTYATLTSDYLEVSVEYRLPAF